MTNLPFELRLASRQFRYAFSDGSNSSGHRQVPADMKGLLEVKSPGAAASSLSDQIWSLEEWDQCQCQFCSLISSQNFPTLWLFNNCSLGHEKNPERAFCVRKVKIFLLSHNYQQSQPLFCNEV